MGIFGNCKFLFLALTTFRAYRFFNNMGGTRMFFRAEMRASSLIIMIFFYQNGVTLFARPTIFV